MPEINIVRSHVTVTPPQTPPPPATSKPSDEDPAALSNFVTDAEQTPQLPEKPCRQIIGQEFDNSWHLPDHQLLCFGMDNAAAANNDDEILQMMARSVESLHEGKTVIVSSEGDRCADDFYEDCLDKWLTIDNYCPICRFHTS